jgi:hypothetical protein
MVRHGMPRIVVDITRPYPATALGGTDLDLVKTNSKGIGPVSS